MEGANYQRAVTPSVDVGSNSNSSLIKGKTLTYQQQSLKTKSPAASTISKGSSNLLLRTQTPYSFNPTATSSLNTSVSTNAVPQTRVLHRGMAAPSGSTTFSSDLNLQGKSVNSISIFKPDEFTSLYDTSTLTNYDIIPISDEIPADGILFARIRNKPDSLVVFRTNEERAKNPERLNLDRRQLDVCPILENEHRLRLLNYQNNNIRFIQNIENLQSLIFLDMYNNKLVTLEGPLSSIRGLRVLMAGKNKINSITNLTKLKKMDVLDLHSNEIRVIEGLDGLTELRVLNLAGNYIARVCNLSTLQSLTELNLRRNHIETVEELNMLPNLQRLFLSHNNISNIHDMSCIFEIKMLIELSLDGNPLYNSSNYEQFRYYMVSKIFSLRYFDLKRITDDEKTYVQSLVDHNDDILAQSNFSKAICDQDSTETGSDKHNRSSKSHHQYMNDVQSREYVDDYQTSHESNNTASVVPTLATQVRMGTIPRSKISFEIENNDIDEKILTIVGDNWEWPQNKRPLAAIVELSICCVKLQSIQNKCGGGFLSTYMPNLKVLRFVENDLESIIDIDEIATLFHSRLSLVDLQILSNPISDLLVQVSSLNQQVSLSVMGSYIVNKFPSLKRLNNLMLTLEDTTLAKSIISPIISVQNIQSIQNSIINMKKAQNINPIRPSFFQLSQVDHSHFSNSAVLVNDITNKTLNKRKQKSAYNDIFDGCVKALIQQAIRSLHES